MIYFFSGREVHRRHGGTVAHVVPAERQERPRRRRRPLGELHTRPAEVRTGVCLLLDASDVA